MLVTKPNVIRTNLAQATQTLLTRIDSVEETAKSILRKKLGVLPHDEFLESSQSIRTALRLAKEAAVGERPQELAHLMHGVRLGLARIDSGVFTEHVMRTEKGNQPLRLTPMHREWHDLAEIHRFLVLWAHIESGKTSMFLVGRLLWRIGRNPGTRAIIVSENGEKAKKVLSQGIAKYILQSTELHEVFPDLVRNPDPSTPWNKSAITVKRPGVIRDPTIQSVGAMRGSVQGARCDFLALDDVVTRRTSGKPDLRRELSGWVNEDLLGRVDPLVAEILVTNTARCKDDLTNELGGKKGAFPKRYPVLDEHGQVRCPWWSKQKIDDHYLSAVEKQRQLFVRDMDDEETSFRHEWAALALAEGADRPYIHSITDEERAEWLNEGSFIGVGVDLAAKKKKPGAKTVLSVLLVTAEGNHQLLWIEGGQWSAPEIRDKILSFHLRYRPVFFVESNGVQGFIKEICDEEAKRKGIHLRVESFHTGTNKHDEVYGVDSISVQMSQGRWIIPSVCGLPLGEAKNLIEGLETYHPQSHMSDYLAATWIAKEGCRQKMTRMRGNQSTFHVGSV